MSIHELNDLIKQVGNRNVHAVAELMMVALWSKCRFSRSRARGALREVGIEIAQ